MFDADNFLALRVCVLNHGPVGCAKKLTTIHSFTLCYQKPNSLLVLLLVKAGSRAGCQAAAKKWTSGPEWAISIWKLGKRKLLNEIVQVVAWQVLEIKFYNWLWNNIIGIFAIQIRIIRTSLVGHILHNSRLPVVFRLFCYHN